MEKAVIETPLFNQGAIAVSSSFSYDTSVQSGGQSIGDVGVNVDDAIFTHIFTFILAEVPNM